jgi:hypothetical protein
MDCGEEEYLLRGMLYLWLAHTADWLHHTSNWRSPGGGADLLPGVNLTSIDNLGDQTPERGHRQQPQSGTDTDA